MAKINGTLIAILNGTDKVLHQTDCTLNVDVDLPDATTKDSLGWAEHINGLRKWSISVSGKYDTSGSGLTPNEILTAIIARTADAVIKFATDGTGSVGWSGNGTFQNLQVQGPMEQPTSYSCTIQGNGALAAI